MTVKIASRAAKTAEANSRNPYALKPRRPSRMPWIFMALLGGIALYFRSAEADDPETALAEAPPPPPSADPAAGAAPASYDIGLHDGGSQGWFPAALRAGPGDRTVRPADDAPLAEWLGQSGPSAAPHAAAGPNFVALYGAGAGLASMAVDIVPGMARPAYARAEHSPEQRPEFEPFDFGSPGYALDLPLA